jgi:hypothetical protein
MTLRNRRTKAAAAAVCALVVTGCTTVSAGSPTPDPADASGTPSSDAGTPPPAEEDLPSDGAPKVTDPIDVSHFEQNPCDVLTPDQAQELGVDPTGKPEEDGFGKICRWRSPDVNGGATTISFFSSDNRGMSSIYRSHAKGELKYFAPLEVEGQPAAAYDVNSSKKPTAACFVAVGLTDELAFSSYTTLSSGNIGQRDPCQAGAQVASMMVKTMRGSA